MIGNCSEAARSAPNAGRFGRLVAPTMFFVGLLCLAGMAFATSWPDMEASAFDSATSLSADAKLRSLRCPWAIAADEVGSVGVDFANPTERATSFLVRSRITRGFVTYVRQDSQQLTLDPHESRTIEWPITADDAAYGRVVMARVLATRSAAQPAREGACGVLVIGVTGVRGQWVVWAGVLLGAAMATAGAALWYRRRRPLRPRDRTIATRAGLLTTLVTASLLAGMLGWWPASHLLQIAALLSVVTILERVYGYEH